MKFDKKQMAEDAMVRIETIQAHQKAVQAAMACISVRRPHTRIEGNLVQLLYEAELNEWHSLLLWGITLDDAERDRIKAAAHQRFLNENTSVAEWLNDGITPSHWLAAEEDEFREMARKAFAPKKP
jgi:hypothetical protein